ncbi:uncharacterized protein LOC127751993 [Frankliniella occidentalis]|uniref:Uncharacterized protein LOC127751993 n=1 Tax=Frankliniella occidentalis TaxID=133901 RepID=A0A9C6XAV3_FRAOC|nr:uncharacterized protein LOC127751993 [Frankliniella occidentalis]
MDPLPDDVLVMAMSLLDVADLLACRLVCKRLAGLAQHPDVWRHRCIDVGRLYDTTSCQRLRLAPCALEISTSVPMEPAACRHGDLRTTSCASRGLAIIVRDCGPEHVATAVQIVKQQVALGRLRGLSLVLADRNVLTYGHSVEPSFVLPEDAADLLFGTLASTPGLELVSLGGNLGPSARIPPRTSHLGTITPSLKTFRCDLVPRPEPFCDYMLAGHAATLEVVHIGYRHVALSSEPLASTSTARLLAGMPNLHKLSCPLMPGLEALAASASLMELEFTVRRVTEANGHGALELLRRALQIRSLHLYFPRPRRITDDDEVDDSEFGVELIGELASSGRSQVETLSIYVDDSYSQTLLVPQLAARLPSLPALRRLVLRLEDPEPLVDAISPLTAPSLRRIDILDDVSPSSMCSHDFLHSSELGALLSRNPLLHVVLEYTTEGCSIFQDDEDEEYLIEEKCDACLLNCHKDLEVPDGMDGLFVGVFAHPSGKCPSPEDHDSDWIWIDINDVQPVY